MGTAMPEPQRHTVDQLLQARFGGLFLFAQRSGQTRFYARKSLPSHQSIHRDWKPYLKVIEKKASQAAHVLVNHQMMSHFSTFASYQNPNRNIRP